MKQIWAIALFLATGSCAYYNGLYNANRLAGEARKAEREGRPGVARSMWSQVAIKADTVLARHPNSDYRDDALYLKGLALSQLGACARAIDPLRLVTDSSPDSELADRGRLQLGRCMLQLGRNDSALAVLTPLAEGESPEREDALWLRGRAFHRLGNDPAALTQLEATRSDSAGFDLALVLLALNDSDGAARVLGAMVERRYDEAAWLSLLDTLGAQNPAAAGELTGLLIAKPSLTRGQRARLILADGARIEGVSPLLAMERYAAAGEVAGDSVEARIASVRRALVHLTLSDDPAAIPAIAGQLRQAMVGGGIPAQLAGEPLAALEAFEADTAGGPMADLHRFVVAERLRDVARARPIAAVLFAGIARDYPGSVIAPKALIAASAVDADLGSDLLSLLRSRYPESPYTLAVMGLPTDRYGFVEDSLRVLLRATQSGRDSEDERVEGRAIGEEVIN